MSSKIFILGLLACIYVAAIQKVGTLFYFLAICPYRELPRLRRSRSFPHIYHTSNAVTRLHVVKSSVNVRKWLTMSDEFIDLQFAGHVVVDEVWQLGSSLDTSESGSSPDTTSDKLEGCIRSVSSLDLGMTWSTYVW